MAIRFNRNFSITKVVTKLVMTVLGLYVGGIIMTAVGSALNQTESAFYGGLSLIGWTVGTYPACVGGNYSTTCAEVAGCSALGQATAVGQNCITAVSGSGVLAVIGVIGIAGVVLEFISF